MSTRRWSTIAVAGRFEDDVAVVRRLRRGGHSPALLGAVAAGIPAFARELGRPPRVKRRKRLSTSGSTLGGSGAAIALAAPDRVGDCSEG
jgi:hypothetical protein